MVSVFSSCFLCFLSLLLLLSLFPFTSISITIPLTHFPKSQYNPTQSPTPYQYHQYQLRELAVNSLTRAHHLKNPPTAATATPLFSRSYGGYSIPLLFGTPPQTLSFILDTGSNFVWFPCTSRYHCKSCSTSSSTSTPSPFIPKKSSSSRIIGCRNPKCAWVHPIKDFQCRDCNNSENCTQICPPYLLSYDSGDTGGIAVSETLRLPNLTVPNFLVGCSVFSSRQPDGIAGFGRGLSSLPSQVGLKKFSYCLLSRKFDDTARSSSLVLDSESDSDKKTRELTYTPFVKNPDVKDKPSLSIYYYVGLRRISVGGRRVKVPYKYLAPGDDGNGGTIIDSGTTFTYMARDAFKPLSEAFVEQMERKKYERAHLAEALTGLGPCFNVTGDKMMSFPELRLHFKGGAEMALPVENYIAYVVGDVEAACMTVVTDGVAGTVGRGGPGVILGNFQMQNFYVEYDLRNDRLGFKKQLCN